MVLEISIFGWRVRQFKSWASHRSLVRPVWNRWQLLSVLLMCLLNMLRRGRNRSRTLVKTLILKILQVLRESLLRMAQQLPGLLHVAKARQVIEIILRVTGVIGRGRLLQCLKVTFCVESREVFVTVTHHWLQRRLGRYHHLLSVSV